MEKRINVLYFHVAVMVLRSGDGGRGTIAPVRSSLLTEDDAWKEGVFRYDVSVPAYSQELHSRAKTCIRSFPFPLTSSI
jgi:hypothetical protein